MWLSLWKPENVDISHSKYTHTLTLTLTPPCVCENHCDAAILCRDTPAATSIHPALQAATWQARSWRSARDAPAASAWATVCGPTVLRWPEAWLSTSSNALSTRTCSIWFLQVEPALASLHFKPASPHVTGFIVVVYILPLLEYIAQLHALYLSNGTLMNRLFPLFSLSRIALPSICPPSPPPPSSTSC